MWTWPDLCLKRRPRFHSVSGYPRPRPSLEYLHVVPLAGVQVSNVDMADLQAGVMSWDMRAQKKWCTGVPCHGDGSSGKSLSRSKGVGGVGVLQANLCCKQKGSWQVYHPQMPVRTEKNDALVSHAKRGKAFRQVYAVGKKDHSVAPAGVQWRRSWVRIQVRTPRYRLKCPSRV
ncbi:hypothetical protein DUNSADRAFT_2660 [Dunaliella salina]|uniref:Encoded protein n=1 Tax=Dunaliella salina TaxID=3046 RepID=A0ABQ7H875_DUNSA|nr:hypothetical protein DUNSADRAFT_2660 [Dunaliella salina]|eukprot:KAF5843047.1 hypothetical protein DUNSADRAFT_2660 [Dunaliella salina]